MIGMIKTLPAARLVAVPQTCLSYIFSFGELGDRPAHARVCRAFRVAAALKTSSPASIRLGFGGDKGHLAAHPTLQPRRLRVSSVGAPGPLGGMYGAYAHLTSLEHLDIVLPLTSDTNLAETFAGCHGSLRSLKISVLAEDHACVRSLHRFARLSALSISRMALSEAGHLPVTLTDLRVDNLTFTRYDPGLGGWIGWGDLLRLPLVRLVLRDTNLEARHLVDLAARMPKLGELEFAEYMPDAARFKRPWAQLENLHTLTFTINHWIVPSALSTIGSLRRLALRRTPRRESNHEAHFSIFARLLGSLSRLTALDISRCDVTQEFVGHMLADSKLQNLTELALGCRDDVNMAIHSLAPLGVLPALQFLDCSNCSNLSSQTTKGGGAPFLSNLPTLPSLHSLCVAGTQVRVCDVADAYPDLERITIDTPDMDLARLVNLREIEVNYTGSTKQRQRWFATLLTSNPKLCLVKLPGHTGIDPEMRRAIADRGVRLVANS